MSWKPDIEALVAPLPADGRSIGMAIAGRRSVRGFLPTPVPAETVKALLTLAARSPSGSNVQPWKVYVCAGTARDAVVATVLDAARRGGDEHRSAYPYYPEPWREPYLGRRRATGWGLYGHLGIGKGDREAAARQAARNYEFFGAPVGLFFTLDADMQPGAYLDLGMLMQTIMIAARGFGLETCPQQAWARYHKLIKPILDIPETEVLVAGMALGHIDPDAPANGFWTDREPVEGFASFRGFEEERR